MKMKKTTAEQMVKEKFILNRLQSITILCLFLASVGLLVTIWFLNYTFDIFEPTLRLIPKIVRTIAIVLTISIIISYILRMNDEPTR